MTTPYRTGEGEAARVTLDDALQRVPERADGLRHALVLEHGTMRALMYAPRGRDPQDPHPQDEVYVVMRGSGTFVAGERRMDFAPGDLLFVPAGMEHRFEDFSDDLAVWVVFYGVEGGERP